jgi:hypothetical protein
MTAIRIAAVGLSDWELNFLQATIGIAAGNDIAQWTYQSDRASAEVLFAGVAAPEASAWLQRRAAANGAAVPGPIVVACVERAAGRAADGARALGLPIVYPELIALLRALESDLHSAAAPAPAPAAQAPSALEAAAVQIEPAVRPDPVSDPEPAADPEPVARAADESATFDTSLARKAHRRLRFYEGTRFLGLARRARDSGRIIEICHARFPTVTIFPMAEAYTCATDVTTLHELFRAPAGEFTSRAAEDRGAAPRLRLPRQPLVRLLYCAAYFGSEGRLPERAEPDDRLELIGAPDFSLLPHGAAERAIAQFLARGPARLLDIVTETAVPLDAILDFVNGCEAIGVMRRLPRDAVIELATPGAGTPSPRAAGTLERLRLLARSLLSGNGEG